jgi:hypothetical protein
MPIEVETPDGGIAEFPDGMAPEQIERALQERFSAPLTPATSHAPTSSPDPLASHSPQLDLQDPETRARAIAMGGGLPNFEAAMGAVKGFYSTAREVGRYVPGGSLLDAIPSSTSMSDLVLGKERGSLYDEIVPEMPPSNPTQETGMAMEQGAEFFAPTPTKIAQLLKGRRAAKIVAEMARGGGITGLHGGSPTEVALAGGLSGVGAGAAEATDAAIPFLKRASIRSILRALGVTKNTEEMAAGVAPDLVSPGGASNIGVGTRRVMLDRAERMKEGAGAQINDAIANSPTRELDVRPIAQEVEDAAFRPRGGAPPRGIMIGGYDLDSLPKQYQDAIEQATAWTANNPALRKQMVDKIIAQAVAAGDVPVSTSVLSGNPATVSAITSEAGRVRSYAGSNNTARIEDLASYRAGAGEAGAQAGSFKGLPSAVAGPSEVAKDAGRGAVARALQAAVPGLKEGDRLYHVASVAERNLSDALAGTLSQRALDRFSAAALGRLAAAAAVGTATGMSTQSYGPGVVAAAVFYTMSGGGFWNSLSAQTKMRLAQAIEGGMDDVALNLLTSSALAYSDSTHRRADDSQIPISAKAKRELERIQSLPDSAVE